MIPNFGVGGIALPIGLLRQGGAPMLDSVQVGHIGIAQSQFVAVHEFGHLLGFTDLYDESKQASDMPYSLMSHFSGNKLPFLDAFSRVQIGWAAVEDVVGEKQVQVRPATLDGHVVRLGTGAKEYFLVENRGPAPPWDTDMQTRGLAVWHVDERRLPDGADDSFVTPLGRCVNCDTWRPLLMLVPADGKFDLQFRRARNDREDLFLEGDMLIPGALREPLRPKALAFDSNRYDGVPTGVVIRDIDTQSASPAILATFVAPESFGKGSCGGVDCPQGLTCSQSQECLVAPSGGELPPSVANGTDPVGGVEPPGPAPAAGCGGGCQSAVVGSHALFSSLLFALWYCPSRRRVRARSQRRLRHARVCPPAKSVRLASGTLASLGTR